MHICNPERHWSFLLARSPQLLSFYRALLEGSKLVEITGTSYRFVENLGHLSREVGLTSYGYLKDKYLFGKNPLLLKISYHRRAVSYGGTYLIFECSDELRALVNASDFTERKEMILRAIKALDAEELHEIGKTISLPQRTPKPVEVSAPPAPEVVEAPEIIGVSEHVEALRSFVASAAQSDATVLLMGETGTGKDIAAYAIHHASVRRKRPWVKINCTALPGELIESELYGHQRGSFTGAHRDHRGAFERANHGTLFLNEIGHMSLEAQAKLLHAVEDRVFDAVGGDKPVRVDVRFIAATNENLSLAVKEGTFRDDLFWRLSVLTHTIPPLRDRKEDIPLLAEHYLQHYSRELKKECKIMSHAMDTLMAYDWPGNVRELANVMKKAVILS